MRAKKSGFTLAETLITLGIIGVVAAITIPGLSNKIRGKRLQTQFKKTYSELNQAAKTFYAETDMPLRDYSDTVYNGSYNSTQTLEEFMKYFKGVTTNAAWYSRSFDKLHNIKNLNLKGEEVEQWPCDESNVFVDMAGRLYSMDNMPQGYEELGEVGPKICVDINGIDKPNKWGVDRFVFVFLGDNSVVPYTGTSWASLTRQYTDEKLIKQYCNTTMDAPAFTCAYFALKNMSPEGNGDYWNNFLKGK